jgi:hypothetical protein
VEKEEVMLLSDGSALDLGRARSRRSIVAAHVAPGCSKAVHEDGSPRRAAAKPLAKRGQSARISFDVVDGGDLAADARCPCVAEVPTYGGAEGLRLITWGLGLHPRLARRRAPDWRRGWHPGERCGLSPVRRIE